MAWLIGSTGADRQRKFNGNEHDGPSALDRRGSQGRNERKSAKAVEVDVRGELLDLNKTFNGITESLSDIANEVTRVVHEVGTEGLLGRRANVLQT